MKKIVMIYATLATIGWGWFGIVGYFDGDVLKLVLGMGLMLYHFILDLFMEKL